MFTWISAVPLFGPDWVANINTWGQPVEYAKDDLGWVRMRGMMVNRNPTVFTGRPTLTLPSGYRPQLECGFPTQFAGTSMGRFCVRPDGQIFLVLNPTVANANIDLNVVYFDPTGGS